MRANLLRLAAGAIALLSACSSGPPRQEVKRFPVLTFQRDIDTVRSACRAALRSNRFPVRETTESGMSSGEVEGNGFTWTLRVTLGQGTGYVSVDPTLKVDRDRRIRPIRRILTNTGELSNEGNPNRRDQADRDPEAIREQAIRDLEARVHEFLEDLEGRMEDRSP